MQTTVLITGGAGYIGTVLTAHLLDCGYKVVLVDNFKFGVNQILHFSNHENIELIKADVRDFDLYKDELNKADYIIPLAALVGAPLCEMYPSEAKSLNYEYIVDLAKRVSSSQRILYPTTNSGYGTKTGEVSCDESTPLEPISLYGETKVEAEKHLLETGKAVTFRFATAFGVSPSMRFDLLVNDFVRQALTQKYILLYEKNFKRNFIHVFDIARCFEFAIRNTDKMLGRPFNCGHSDFNLSKLELAEKIKSYVPDLYIHCNDYQSDVDRRNYVVSNKRIEQLGYKPKKTLDDGILEILKLKDILKHIQERHY